MLELAKTGGAIQPAPEQQVLERMQAARAELARARTIGEAKQIADGMAAIVAYLRQQTELGLEIINEGNALKLEAERRIGEFLKQPGAVRGRGREEKIAQPARFSAPTLKDLGLKKDLAHRCREVANVPAETIQQLAKAATAKGRELTREAVLKEAKRRRPATRTRREPAPRPTIQTIPADLLNRIVTGDARNQAKRIPSESVALVLTDPVYWNTEDYRWLAEECERVLVPGGSVIAQVGNVQRFDAECAMRESGLEWVDLLAEVYPLAMCGLHHIRVQIGWKPHLWFSKGPRADLDGRNLYAPNCKTKNSGRLMNRVHAKGKHSANESKDLHEWGDAEEFAAGLIERLCCPGDVLWDPFTGSGTVPVVCKRLGVSFIASEIDPAKAKAARERLEGITREAVIAQRSLGLEAES